MECESGVVHHSNEIWIVVYGCLAPDYKVLEPAPSASSPKSLFVHDGIKSCTWHVELSSDTLLIDRQYLRPTDMDPEQYLVSETTHRLPTPSEVS